MSAKKRSSASWIFVIFLAVSIVLILMGQTMAVFDYDLTVSLGLQEDPVEVGETVKQVNRGLGAGDTIIYIPLLTASLIGLWLKKKWALIVTAATAGVSAYWSVTVSFMFFFLPGSPGYTHVPGFEIWTFILTYMIFGIWALFYIIFKGETLLE